MVKDTSVEARSRRRLLITSGAIVTVALLLSVVAVVLFFSRYRYYASDSQSMSPTIQPPARFWVDRWAFRGQQVPRRGDVVVYTVPPEAIGSATYQETEFVHRVIALPGDGVRIRAASATIGGHAVDLSNFESDNLHDVLREELGIDASLPLKITQSGVSAGSKFYDLTQVAAVFKAGKRQLQLFPGQVIVNGTALSEPYCSEDVDYEYPTSSTATLTVPSNHVLVLGDNRNHAADSHVWGTIPTSHVSGMARIEPKDTTVSAQ